MLYFAILDSNITHRYNSGFADEEESPSRLTSVVMAFLASHHPVLFLDIALYFNSQRDRGWRTFKRPGVEAFLEQLAQHYELVIYSDQLSYVSLPLPISTIDDGH